jgi:hypothetical protein
MFSKLSRYRRVPDIAVPDAGGRVVAAKDIRQLPDATGTFRHTVTAGDRLDQLAFTYYSQPLQYWHICDANPQFLSPLALLGAESIVTTRFPVTVPSGQPPWAALLRDLAGVLYVESVTVLEEASFEPQQVLAVDGEPVTWYRDRFAHAVQVSYHQPGLTPAALAERIRAAGFHVGPPAEVGQLGQEILIPPAVIG